MAVAFLLHSCADIDPGLVRESNQDRAFCYVYNPARGPSLALLMVADGMSGLRDGDIASGLAIDTLKKQLLPYLERDLAHTVQPVSALAHKLEQEIQRTNLAIYSLVQNQAGQIGMGTTIACALVQGEHAVLAHVGDSRMYLLGRDGLQQIGEDHTLEGAQAANRTRRRQFASDYPNVHLLTRALGLEARVEVDLQPVSLEVGDRLMLCTDGLWRALRDPAQLEAMIYRAETCEKAVRVLISAAREYGGDDNIAVAVCDVNPRAE
ncbi:MAG: serine/threonine-protein phosphatase [Anaerolineales bacterium]|nr:serine/threonine-protein phosphatase [Anaerolineales bacterium]